MKTHEPDREVIFESPIFSELVTGLPAFVSHLNAEDGQLQDGHQSELVLQREIGKRLRTWLPSTTLVRQNVMLASDASHRYIPDIIIDRIGGGCWAIFELKTLLQADQLSANAIRQDLRKLCKYAAVYPDAFCLFLLIVSESKLNNLRRQTSWATLPISLAGDAFAAPSDHAQKIDDSWMTQPWLFNTTLSPFVFIWRVLHIDHIAAPCPVAYRFHARMDT